MLECYSKAVCTSPYSSSPFYSWFPKFKRPNYYDHDKAESCPFYFKWIGLDLLPWKSSGITLDMVEEAKKAATFRLMIVNGRLFVEIYYKCYQTRDTFTIWAILQLLKMYPGMIPDLDLMFNCEDKPFFKRSEYNNQTGKLPPPMFGYSGNQDTYDVVFPDWSYWGWAEIRSDPWEVLVEEIRNGSQKMKWVERDPTAFWKGNPDVANVRKELMKCSDIPNWNGHLVAQDWNKESKAGFKDSKLADQCKHRYKIYIEGNAWSVSLKNIMACNSLTLLVKSAYYAFFQRGLIPQQHYWPVRVEKKCESINFAVNWGNNHTEEAIAIGKAGSDFMLNELKMKYVYDYMFHVLTVYAKLLKYKPSVTPKAVEYCSQNLLCVTNEVEKQYMKDTIVTAASPSPPCQPGEVDDNIKEINDFTETNRKIILNVQDMEEKA